jgi:hypothetical protein
MIELIISANPAPPKPAKAIRQPAFKNDKPEKKRAVKQTASRSPSYLRAGGAPPLGSNDRIDRKRYEMALAEMRAARREGAA